MDESTLCNVFGLKGVTAYSTVSFSELFGAGNGFTASISVGGGRFQTDTNDRKPKSMITYTLNNFSNIESMYIIFTLPDLKKISVLYSTKFHGKPLLSFIFPVINIIFLKTIIYFIFPTAK